MSDDKFTFDFEYKIRKQIQEDEENFVYTTILPFCESITEKKLSKKELEEILRKGMKYSNLLDQIKKVREEIQKLRGCSCSCSDGIIDDVEDILDELIESEVKE